jgi:hypothetical protein
MLQICNCPFVAWLVLLVGCVEPAVEHAETVTGKPSPAAITPQQITCIKSLLTAIGAVRCGANIQNPRTCHGAALTLLAGAQG